ncbi:MAG: aldo/keto reductase [Anaerolineae bacterium]|nr:aldo/keto reductase [Anaerolineae bacterium]
MSIQTAQLGSSGITVSRLGIGTGTNGWAKRSDQTALGLEGLANLLVEAHSLGVRFWDAADQYGSHPHVAAALRRVPREEVVITTKTTARRERQAARDVDRFLKELGTDVLDLVLLHGLNQANWPSRYEGAMAALARAKEVGKVRAVGFSCHGLGALRRGVNDGWSDVVFVRINYDGTRMDGDLAEVTPVIEQLYEAGKGLYAMKVLGCGQLKADVEKAFRFVLSLGTVHALSIGMTSRNQLRENVRMMEALAPGYPLRGH